MACFRRLEGAGHAHTTLDAGGVRAVTEAAAARWVKVVLGNLKGAISCVYHAIAQGHYARGYLAEAAYRFNRRFRLREMLTTRYGDDALKALSRAGSAHGKKF